MKFIDKIIESGLVYPQKKEYTRPNLCPYCCTIGDCQIGWAYSCLMVNMSSYYSRFMFDTDEPCGFWDWKKCPLNAERVYE